VGTPVSENRGSIAVIGGGLAGMSASAALAEKGYRITLIEKLPTLGGRAGSHYDAAGSEWIDNCQHILMPCCTNLLDFYRRIGVSDKIRFYPKIPFIDTRGRISRLHSSWLPAPLHLLPSFLKLRFLSPRDRLHIASSLISLLRLPGHVAEAREPFRAWLERHRQSERAIGGFWQAIIVSALNEEPAKVSTGLASWVFVEASLSNPAGWWPGIPVVPLGSLYGEPLAHYLRRRGGSVLLRSEVLRIDGPGATGYRVALRDGRRVEADKVVLAVPWHAAEALLPSCGSAAAASPRFRLLEPSPITGVHLWFDRSVTDLDFAVLPGRQVQWIFNKSRNWHSPEGAGTYLQAVSSASRGWAGLNKQQILAIVLQELGAVLPKVREAALLRSRILKNPFATFSPDTLSEARRPETRFGSAGFYLAGDWVQTGWPSTMEGAVRSGYLAAEAVLADENRNGRILVPDLKRAGLMRLAIGGKKRSAHLRGCIP